MADGAGLFSDVREGREGVQLERTLRALWFLLDGWCNYDGSGNRTPCEGEASKDCLRAIYFDKLAILAFRVWDESFRHTGKEFPKDLAMLTV